MAPKIITWSIGSKKAAAVAVCFLRSLAGNCKDQFLSIRPPSVGRVVYDFPLGSGHILFGFVLLYLSDSLRFPVCLLLLLLLQSSLRGVSRGNLVCCSYIFSILSFSLFAASLSELQINTIYICYYVVSHLVESHCRYQRSTRNIYHECTFPSENQRILRTFCL